MEVKWPYEFPGAYWLDEKEGQAVQDVLQNGSLFRYYGLGEPKYVDTLEKAARNYYGIKYALALNSGTGALITAMSAMKIGPGCEVIIPAFLWVATAAAVIQCNAIPVLCEVDDSFCMDSKDLERKINDRTKLILPIHMAGAPCNMEAIMEVASRHKIPVLEDCAQCNGGMFQGQRVGSIGTCGIFSLQLNKNMTCGEGGLLVTNDESVYLRAFSAHDMGMIRVNGRLAMPEPDSIAWGAGRRMNELSGAVASVQIEKLPKIVESMRASKRNIKEMLKEVPGLTFRHLNDPQGDTGAFLIMIFENDVMADSVLKYIKAAGLHNAFRISEYGLHIYYNIPALVKKVSLSMAGNPWNLTENASSNYNYTKGTCSQSDDLFGRSILLPIPSKLTDEQEKAAAKVINAAVATAVNPCGI